MTFLTIILVFNFFASSLCVDYRNYSLYRGFPKSVEDLDFYNSLGDLYDVNYWREPASLKHPVEFAIKPEHKEKFMEAAKKRNLNLTMLISDLEDSFEKQTVKAYIRTRKDTFGWDDFYQLDDIYHWLNDLKMAHENEMAVFPIGKSHEGRDINVVRIALQGSSKENKVIIEGGIHAREWMSPAFVTYLIHQVLTSQTSKNLKWKNIGKKYVWYFIPVLNPDGYYYTHKEDRMWRKNRAPQKNYNFGVDINRNFDAAFGSIGISNDSKSNTYCGPGVFSEQESTALAKFVKKHSTQLQYYFSFHSYGQYIIIPYAYSPEHKENFNEVKLMCTNAAKEIHERYKTQYKIGNAHDTVGYMTSGVSADWVKEQYKIKYVIIFELRDKGDFGFALPPKLIKPTCLETFDGMIALLDRNNDRTKHSSKSCFCRMNLFVFFTHIFFVIILLDF